MASWIRRKASSLVSPTAMHPGKSGTCAPKEVAPCSITTAYFMRSILLESGLLEDGRESSFRHLDTQLSGHCHSTRFRRMSKLAMASFRSDEQPTILCQAFQDLSDFHLAVVARAQAY